MSALPNRLITADELFRRSDEFGRCELIEGVLHQMSPAGGRHGRTALKLGHLILMWCEEANAGLTVGAETGFRLGRGETVRAPDVAFIAKERLQGADTEKFIPIAPDFCAEVLSPSDRASAVSEKCRWWMEQGVRLLWVVDPENETVTVYRQDGSISLLQADDDADGDDILPGFSIRVSRVFG